MQQICSSSWCKQPFEITQADLAFLEKLSPTIGNVKEPLPPPTRCPDCRQQRKTVWRNERSLHRRTCSLCRKSIVSIYHEETQFPVYCSACFFSDGWEPTATGRAFEPSEPMMEQMRRLQMSAPRIALLSKSSENSDFTNHSGNNRNSYLSIAVFSSEDVLYSRHVFSSRQIVDCTTVLRNSELLYESSWVKDCYHSTYLIDCSSVTDCHCCIDLIGCNHCFLCSNLRNKSYCIRNEQLTREAYEKEMIGCQGRWSRLQPMLEAFAAWRRDTTIYRNLHLTNCDQCSGDYLTDCRNMVRCFEGSKAEDFRYCDDFSSQAQPCRDCMDCNNFNTCELLYEVHGQVNGYGNIATNFSYDVRNCYYIDNCHNCENCFCCIGLHHKQYCILNKQYTKEEYETIVPRIIEHMRSTNEWGEFFPMTLSPFAYNVTLAQEHHPLSKEEVLRRGWRWEDPTDDIPKLHRIIPATELPDAIDEVTDDILNAAIACQKTKRPFRITRQELEFYRSMRLPLPRLHPDERFWNRVSLKNPRKLWRRQCATCQREMETTFAPERSERVVCEECYLKEVY